MTRPLRIASTSREPAVRPSGRAARQLARRGGVPGKRLPRAVGAGRDSRRLRPVGVVDRCAILRHGEDVSERNVDLTRGILDAWNSRDIEAFVAGCDPGVEIHSAFAALGAAQYSGHDGVLDWWRDLDDAWGGDFNVEPEAFFDLGNRTLAFVVWRARGRHSGADVSMSPAFLASWRDDLMVFYKSYTQRDDAMHDLGVTEDELEPIAP